MALQICKKCVCILRQRLASSPSRSYSWSFERYTSHNHVLTIKQRLKIFSWSHVRTFSSTEGHSSMTVEDIAKYMKERPTSKVVVMAGAGISTLSGIPDFRTPVTGLYDNVHKYSLPYPEAIFDLEYFDVDPRPFFALAKELYPGVKRPNIAHHFVRLLHEKNMLHMMYTQNIDALERLAGIPEKKLVEAHGSFATAHCRRCKKEYEAETIKEAIFNDEIPKCDRKSCQAVVKPDIVFFGEQMPLRFFSYPSDVPQTDLLIVMGTSLEVHPFAGIADFVLPGVPRILFNRDPVSAFMYNARDLDVFVQGDLQETLQNFVELLGWTDELVKLEAADKQKQAKEE